MSEHRRESPLVAFEHAPETGIELEQLPFRGYLNLRGDANAPEFVQAVEAHAGIELPLTPNTATHDNGRTALWLGPDEWLLITSPDWQSDLARRLRHGLQDVHSAVTDVSSGQTTLVLVGPGARTVLAKGCSVDLHPRAFSPGCCAQTLIAKADALIYQHDATPSFELIVRRSFAEYLWLWLQDASRGMARRVSARGDVAHGTPRLVRALGVA